MTTAQTATAPAAGTGRVGPELDAQAPVWRTLSVARPAAGRLVLAALLGAGAVAAAIGLMATSAWMISRAAQHPGASALGIAVVGVQFFGLSRGLFRYGERLVGHNAAFGVLSELRVRIYRRLERLAPAGLPEFRRGDLLARLVRDVDSLQELLLRVVPPFGVAVTVGAATVAVVAWLLPAAACVLAACLVLAVVAVPLLTHRLAHRSQVRQAAAHGELTASIVELMEGAPDLVAYGAADEQLRRIATVDAELTAMASSHANTKGVGLALTTLLSGTAMWGGLLLGVEAVHAGRLAGVRLAVVALIPLAAFEIVVGLPSAAQSLDRARRAARRVFAVLDTPDPVTEPPTPTPVPAAPHTLALESLGARYPRTRRLALRDARLELTPGRRVAVVGPSGAGKSTLAAVLLRFLPYEAGRARLDDTDLDRLNGDDVRRVVGLVPQDAHLFDTTIAANLRLAHPDATDAELRTVLGRVGLGPWLDGLPLGLDTEVGVAGDLLSGGQRQRLAVARALLARFDVLVLDEPTEHLDPDGARALTADLLDLTEGRSTIVITHRLDGLDAVDAVVRIEDGCVVADAQSVVADAQSVVPADVPAAASEAPADGPASAADRHPIDEDRACVMS